LSIEHCRFFRNNPESNKFFTENFFIKSIMKYNAANKKEKAKKFGLPPHAIISE